jgi:TFIIF-interacting CTD phosphatase-like protein
MSKIYELVLFTAATKEYAEKVIDVIDAKKRI